MTAAVVVRRSILAPAERVFDAWLDPAALAVWMRRSGSETSLVTADPRVGGGFAITMRDPSGDFVHTGTYLVIDRPRRIEFTWHSHAAGRGASHVAVTFEPDGAGTLVELRHEGLPDAESARLHDGGWNDVLDGLVRHAIGTEVG
ncbi:SRPBCC family protein [Agromyces seonyuensis]|uniref:SRPBCC domain-containing protein n=1 Tax=Agromyces seonyuensis TaxID=2662446 RepID=A0A6I4NYP6_9MICO|nr:SRPBCC family protein [Agromyces seonyuensis]MWB99453.1 SRPBCC domain-containing protein [Agromyces seonyuensis]